MPGERRGAMPPATKEEPKVEHLDLRHKKGCPETRVESYSDKRPANQGGARVQVTRCIECGEHAVEEA
jgi:hypothetical protein